MKDNVDEVEFETTGRKVYANLEIVGIDAAGLVYEGCDDDFSYGQVLTKPERTELATHMIARWTAYRDAE